MRRTRKFHIFYILPLLLLTLTSYGQDVKEELKTLSDRFQRAASFQMTINSEIISSGGEINKSQGEVYKSGRDYYSNFNNVERIATGPVFAVIDHNKKLIVLSYNNPEKDYLEESMQITGMLDSTDLSQFKVEFEQEGNLRAYTFQNMLPYENVTLKFTGKGLLKEMVYDFPAENSVRQVKLYYKNYRFDKGVSARDLQNTSDYRIRGEKFYPLGLLKKYRLVDQRNSQP